MVFPWFSHDQRVAVLTAVLPLELHHLVAAVLGAVGSPVAVPLLCARDETPGEHGIFTDFQWSFDVFDLLPNFPIFEEFVQENWRILIWISQTGIMDLGLDAAKRCFFF